MVNQIEIEKKKLIDAGLKLTNKRIDMLQVFIDQDKYLSARNIQELLSDKHPNLSFDTIYRNLKLFTEENIIEENDFNGERVFRIHCGHPHSHHHHFICTNCGATIPIAVCPLGTTPEELQGCTIQSHRFEIFGLCKDCTKKAISI